jgi:hypothetical protein
VGPTDTKNVQIIPSTQFETLYQESTLAWSNVLLHVSVCLYFQFHILIE